MWRGGSDASLRTTGRSPSPAASVVHQSSIHALDASTPRLSGTTTMRFATPHGSSPQLAAASVPVTQCDSPTASSPRVSSSGVLTGSTILPTLTGCSSSSPAASSAHHNGSGALDESTPYLSGTSMMWRLGGDASHGVSLLPAAEAELPNTNSPRLSGSDLLTTSTVWSTVTGCSNSSAGVDHSGTVARTSGSPSMTWCMGGAMPDASHDVSPRAAVASAVCAPPNASPSRLSNSTASTMWPDASPGGSSSPSPPGLPPYHSSVAAPAPSTPGLSSSISMTCRRGSAMHDMSHGSSLQCDAPNASGGLRSPSTTLRGLSAPDTSHGSPQPATLNSPGELLWRSALARPDVSPGRVHSSLRLAPGPAASPPRTKSAAWHRGGVLASSTLHGSPATSVSRSYSGSSLAPASTALHSYVTARGSSATRASGDGGLMSTSMASGARAARAGGGGSFHLASPSRASPASLTRGLDASETDHLPLWARVRLR
eukprot:NODE_4917_length_1831_cov_3.086268.p1 GENE.NODE_4917_length_1831_cov_3.086268~~NODE_4917_length_1831_cov_3.086268.p1  ORF type:complete len:494 (+),score=64.22 NODE_4917_length_1831_cov_3.086268:27-1484(+)